MNFHRFHVVQHLLTHPRMKLLQIAMDERYKVLIATGGNHLSQSISDSGRSSQTGTGTIGPVPNLAISVKPPWERATTPANVPYYIKYVKNSL